MLDLFRIGYWQVIGSMYLPSSWPGSESFQQTSLPLRLLLLPLWVKIVLSKYIFSWLLAESVCVLSGLSFVEQREDGSVDWRGCANVKVHRLFSLSCLCHIFVRICCDFVVAMIVIL